MRVEAARPRLGVSGAAPSWSHETKARAGRVGAGWAHVSAAAGGPQHGRKGARAPATPHASAHPPRASPGCLGHAGEEAGARRRARRRRRVRHAVRGEGDVRARRRNLTARALARGPGLSRAAAAAATIMMTLQRRNAMHVRRAADRRVRRRAPARQQVLVLLVERRVVEQRHLRLEARHLRLAHVLAHAVLPEHHPPHEQRRRPREQHEADDGVHARVDGRRLRPRVRHGGEADAEADADAEEERAFERPALVFAVHDGAHRVQQRLRGEERHPQVRL